jgi:predicted ATPase/predicted negative regulator of RcsB-dependent stress response
VGRDEELSHLAALIHSGAKLVTLWGPAGIGKTRLVLEASQRGAFELVEFVELERARDLDDALRIVVHRLSTSTRGGESPDRAIGRALGRLGEGVVVLDRVEHLAGELGRVIDEWRRAAPDLCFVVTSRERLSWNEGLTLELRPLPGRDADGDAASANGPTLSAAGALFLDRARQVDPGFSLTAETIRGVEAAAALLEGIPLAIELAAARVGLLGLDGVLQRLSRRLDSLGGLGRGAARGETQISMRAAIGASVELLSGAERRAFAECSVFAGSFTLAAAEAVLDTDPARGSVREQLESLRNKSLLSTDSNLGTSEPRFCLFSVIREYAASELGSLGDRAATRARHGAYYTRRAAELGAQRRRDEKGVEALEPDTDNLLAAIDWALFKPEPELRLGLEALLALEPVIMARGPLPAFLRLIDAAITRTAGSVPEDERLLGARLRQLRARLAATSGRFDSARADLELVLELSRQRADRRLEASALLDLGVTFHLARSLRAARDCYERALGLLDAAGEPELEARCYGNLGAILHDEEHFTEAAAYYWRAVRHLEACGERRMRGNFLNNLAVLEQELGELIRARKHFDAALRLLAQIGDARLRAITLGNLGVLEALGGDWALARSCHERALRLLEPLDDRNSEALCRARLSATLGLLGDTARSAAELNHALGLARDSDTSLVETIQLHRAFQHLALARLSLDSGDSPTALACLERARLLCDEAGQDNANGPAPAKLSDDVRITLRLLQPLLDRLSARLSG